MDALPQWTERPEKTGLDPLGMQNAGVVLYQSLLPGISNVTLRMRYYGYYCWVSDAYARNGATDEFAAWRSWVRRAEALYALVASHVGGQGGVGGVEWADRRLAHGEEVIDFADATSTDPSAKRYLRQSLGIFGGAYYTQMVEVGLFREGEHGIQRATKGPGTDVADAFRASIGPAIEQVLLQGIRTASVMRSDLELLAPVVPSAVPETSDERRLYERVLFAPGGVANDNDGSRGSSLRLLLDGAEAMGRRPDVEGIRWHLFDGVGVRAGLEEQRLRWKAYQCQDMFQVAAAALLSWSVELMAEVEGGRTLAEISAEVGARLARDEPVEAAATWADFRSSIDPASHDYKGAWSRLTGRRGTAEAKAWETVRLIAALAERMHRRPDLAEVVSRELAVRGQARSIVTELRWFGRREATTVADLVAGFVVDRVVRRHSWVAPQKLRRQRDYTFLFEVRDGRLVQLGRYQPVPTTPRLAPAVQFLEDVGLVDAGGLTARGRSVVGANS